MTTLDFNNRSLEPKQTVRIRQGSYAGCWATVTKVEGLQVKVRVSPLAEGNPTADLTLRARSVERTR